MGRSFCMVSSSLPLSIIPRSSPAQWQTVHSCLCTTRHASTNPLPRVVQPSLWENLVPKPFRRSAGPSTLRPSRWERLRHIRRNPATVFVAFGLMIGSNAINLLLLRNSMANYSRTADAKIALLREVLERVQRGEQVDVEGLLGTDNEESDKAWKEALEEVESDGRAWQSRKRRKAHAAEARESQDSPRSRSDEPSGTSMSTAPSPKSKDASPPLDYLVPAEERGKVLFL